MTNNKVFVGPGNIAGIAMYLARSLRSVGIDAKSFSYDEHPFGYPCDFDNILIKVTSLERNIIQKILINKYSLKVIWSIQKVLLLIYASIIYDTFIFISTETFFLNNSDLRILKFFKKKTGFIFVGCPERDPEDFINKESRGICFHCVDKGMQTYLDCYNGDKKKKKIAYISKHAEIIFTHRDSAGFIIDKEKIKFAFIISDLNITKNNLINKFNDKKEITICHLPSNSLMKGTVSVLSAIEKLRSKGLKFNFISKRVKHSEIDSLLKETHILIDQFSGSHGLLAVEGMANGCVVICRVANWFREDFPEIPMVSCEPEELEEVIEKLIKDRQKMLSIANRSFEYYQKFHTLEVTGNYYKENLKLD